MASFARMSPTGEIDGNGPPSIWRRQSSLTSSHLEDAEDDSHHIFFDDDEELEDADLVEPAAKSKKVFKRFTI